MPDEPVDPAQDDFTSDDENQKNDSSSELSLPEEAEELIKQLPEAQRKAVQAVLIGISQKFVSIERIWRAPLPHPDTLKGYNDAVPNGAERVLALAEKQAAHRMEMEKSVIPEQQRQGKRGQWMGYTLAILFLICSMVLILSGHEVSGSILGSFDIVALVSIFVIGKIYQRKDKDEDDDEDE